MRRGILYIVSGTREIFSECIHSAASVKKYNPDLPIQVITNIPSKKFKSGYFDFVDVRPSGLHPLKAKVRYLTESRFENTLFLDADTEVRTSIEHLFRDTSHHFSFTYDNLCDWKASPVKFLAQESLDINTGFILFRSSPEVHAVFTRWYDLLAGQDESDMRPGHNCDQVYFNRHIRGSILSDPAFNVRILPNDIYNVRPWCWHHLKKNRNFSQTKILHAHHLNHTILTKARRKITSIFSS